LSVTTTFSVMDAEGAGCDAGGDTGGRLRGSCASAEAVPKRKTRQNLFHKLDTQASCMGWSSWLTLGRLSLLLYCGVDFSAGEPFVSLDASPALPEGWESGFTPVAGGCDGPELAVPLCGCCGEDAAGGG
jgi:hypothetical protein